MRTGRSIIGLAALLLVAACEGGSAPANTPVTFASHTYFPLDKLHAGIDCNTCHTGASFKQVSCTSGCHDHGRDALASAHDGLTLNGVTYAFSDDGNTCLTCHPDDTLRSPGHERFFPIASGDSHGTLTCHECHTVRGDYKQVDCAGCHQREHPDTDSHHAEVVGYAPSDSGLCLRCHGENPLLHRVAAHDEAAPMPFSIAAGPHHLQECLNCHPGTQASKPFAADFTLAAVDCIDCHAHPQQATDGVHPAGPVWDRNAPHNCLNCHRSGEGIDHGPLFPLTGDHGNLDCASCHPTGDRTVGAIDCLTCHGSPPRKDLATVHADVADYAPDSARCVACHADGQLDTVGTHTFPIQAPATNPGSFHYRVACAGCHDQMRKDSKPYGIDFKQRTCTTDCHDADGHHTQAATGAIVDHQGSSYAYATEACLTCHSTGGPFDHRAYPIGTGTTHAGVVCEGCHTDPTNEKVVDCKTCHASQPNGLDAPHATEPGYKASTVTTTNCLRCHPDDKSFLRIADHKQLSRGGDRATITGGDHRMSCIKCHDATRMDITAFVAADFSVSNCGQCHN